MFSKELSQLDKNTVQFMIDQMQDELDAQKAKLDEQKTQLLEKDAIIATLQKQIQNDKK